MIIWIASYPKSGNTWLRALISTYFYSKDGVFNDLLLREIDQFPTSKYFKDYDFNKKIAADTCRFWIKAQEEVNSKIKLKFFKKIGRAFFIFFLVAFMLLETHEM
jgi:hypothetical protein